MRKNRDVGFCGVCPHRRKKSPQPCEVSHLSYDDIRATSLYNHLQGNLIYIPRGSIHMVERPHSFDAEAQSSWRHNAEYKPQKQMTPSRQGSTLILRLCPRSPQMDFPPMDWGALFAFNPAVLDPHLADPTGTSATGTSATSDANGPEGLRRA